ncbi:universal stress protein [Zwartia sp.]|uniref:universal stress protein n=1 Tax=Zwartia sp. TaxID=2978004 RepID=UPI0027270ED5|nr:universal stress protein [Zwartia sp.]MDO9025645.1 universal stress protein [Zwartia sp.]
MFKHLLVPIADDEKLADRLKGIASLVKSDGAKVTLAFVSDPELPNMYSSSRFGHVLSEDLHKKTCEEYAEIVFAKAKPVFADMTVNTCHVFSSTVYEGILDAAKKSGVDAIIMASHKRTGFKGALIGSDTQAVIVHATIPVVVL